MYDRYRPFFLLSFALMLALGGPIAGQTVDGTCLETDDCPPPPTVNEPPITLNFQKTAADQTPFVDRPFTWDYQAGSFIENGVTHSWYCGGTDGFQGDGIFYARHTNHSGRVSGPTQILPSPKSLPPHRWDSRHTCSPSTIRHRHPAIMAGKDLWYVYYECVPRMWNRTPQCHSYNATDPTACEFEIPTGFTDRGFSQVCLAVSEDLETWEVYNESLWDSSRHFADPMTTGPTPVIEAHPQILSTCNVGFNEVEQRHEWDYTLTCKASNNKHYGSGHPVAVSMASPSGTQRRIQLFFWESVDRRMKVANGIDGFHFNGPFDTSLPFVSNIRYLPTLEVDGTIGTWVGLVNSFSDNYFVYSTDAPPASASDTMVFRTHEMLESPRWPPREDMRIGEVFDNKCLASGAATLVGDRHGHVDNPQFVDIVSNEGYLPINAGPTSKCRTHSNYPDQIHPRICPHPCVDPACLDDDPATPCFRGSSWGLFEMGGVFIGDRLNGYNISLDGQTIFYLEDGVRYPYDCLDTSCTESFLLFNDFDDGAYWTVSQDEMVLIEQFFPLPTIPDAMRPGAYRLRGWNVKPVNSSGRHWVDERGRFSYPTWQHFKTCNEVEGNAAADAIVELTPGQWAKISTDYSHQGSRPCQP